jgi:hypothetical protein
VHGTHTKQKVPTSTEGCNSPPSHPLKGGAMESKQDLISLINTKLGEIARYSKELYDQIDNKADINTLQQVLSLTSQASLWMKYIK